jgi:protein TonB
MRGLFEFSGFAGLALALHVVAIQGLPQGSESAGSGGQSLVTVSAVSGALSEMVATWDRPPQADMSALSALPQTDLATPADTPPSSSEGSFAQQLRPALPAILPVPLMDAALPRDVLKSAPPPQVNAVEPPPRIRPPARPAAIPTPAKPTAKPLPQERQRSASLAAGQGAAAAKGTRGPAANASLAPGVRQSLMAEWGADIRSHIDRAKPRGSGRGVVSVMLNVGRDGTLRSVSVAQSSGQRTLDQMAVTIVRSVGRMPSAPAGLAEPSYTFRVPIRFN